MRHVSHALQPLHVKPTYTCRLYPLEEMAAAHEYAEQGHVRGKVVISICEDPAARWLAAGAPAAEAVPAQAAS